MKRPVAFRVKDHADGWLLCHDEEVANHEAEEMGGALVQGLYVRDGSPWSSDWQPIETAPKDETFVLLYVPHQQLETGPVVMGMHWRDERRGDDGRFKKGRWYHVGNGWLGVEADLRPAWCEPTHWMPLPTPPERNAHS